MFETLPDIHVDSSKHIPIPFVGISNTYAINYSNVQNENDKNTEIHLSLSSKELTDIRNDNTFCATMLKIINDKKVSSKRYFVNNKKL